MNQKQCPYFVIVAQQYHTCEYSSDFIEPTHKTSFCDRQIGYKDCSHYLHDKNLLNTLRAAVGADIIR